jgi:hypothetical protein
VPDIPAWLLGCITSQPGYASQPASQPLLFYRTGWLLASTLLSTLPPSRPALMFCLLPLLACHLLPYRAPSMDAMKAQMAQPGVANEMQRYQRAVSGLLPLCRQAGVQAGRCAGRQAGSQPIGRPTSLRLNACTALYCPAPRTPARRCLP